MPACADRIRVCDMATDELVLEKSHVVIQVLEDGSYSVGSQGRDEVWHAPMEKVPSSASGSTRPATSRVNRGGWCTGNPIRRPT